MQVEQNLRNQIWVFIQLPKIIHHWSIKIYLAGIIIIISLEQVIDLQKSFIRDKMWKICRMRA